MEIPPSAEDRDRFEQIDAMFARRDKIYHAWMEIILEDTHKNGIIKSDE